jgi:hypothetical protein
MAAPRNRYAISIALKFVGEVDLLLPLRSTEA